MNPLFARQLRRRLGVDQPESVAALLGIALDILVAMLVLGVWVSILFLVRHRLRPSEEMGRSTHVGAVVAD